MAVDAFTERCKRGEESEAAALLERDPGIQNKLDSYGWTGLMAALGYKRHSLSRWLLSLPGLETNICDGNSNTSLHKACEYDAPLDIVIALVRLSTWGTVNMKNRYGRTALDWAVLYNNTSAALYLSWLGAACREENRKYKEVTLQTWIDAGCQLEVQYWAVAANNVDLLKLLARMKNVTLDSENLKTLAKLFNRQKMFSLWGEESSLASLAWEEVWQSCPALPALRPGTALPLLNPASFITTVHLLCC